MKLTRRQMLAAVSLIPGVLCTACAKDTPKGNEGGSGSQTSGSVKEAENETNNEDAELEEAINELTLEQQVAQLFIVAPESLTGVGVQTRAGDATREAMQGLPVGGFCWFAQNLEDPDQTREMLANVRAYSMDICGLPAFNAVDEEGGNVVRVASNAAFGVDNVGNMRDIGTDGTAADAKTAASYIGEYLKDLGFNANLAPVADVVSLAANVDLVWRSFGTDPDKVSEMVTAQVEGYTGAGIVCSPKHFPGIGFAWGDSETEAITSDRTLQEMEATELKPFKAAIKAGAPMIMVGHLSCPQLSSSGLPASLNADIVDGILREELGFDGLVITDALKMGALADVVDDPVEIALTAFEAGCDLLLMPSDLQASYDKVLDAVRSGRISEERLHESLKRIIKVKNTL